MQFGVLGPLALMHDGYPITMTAPKHRALLAALLVHANQATSVDRLIAYLWGERAPATARTLVKVYVSQVRHLLCEQAGEPSDVLVTQPPGYRLRVAPDEFDLWIFERLVSEAEAAKLDGRPGEAAEALGAALALWRGEPLADVPSDLLREGEVPRLIELRLAAVEARVEVGLTLGRHRELVGELQALVAAYPLRERLHGYLMLALYRCGRRADALVAYQAARTTIAEELGLDPDPALRHLEQAILSGDTALVSHKGPPSPLSRQSRRSSRRRSVHL